MSDTHLPTPVQLDPPGPHMTPEISEFLGFAPAKGQLPHRACFMLDGGTELQIPMGLGIQEEFFNALYDLYGEETN